MSYKQFYFWLRFLQFITHGKPHIVPDYGFYREYISNIDKIVPLKTTLYKDSDNCLDLQYIVEPKTLCEALKQCYNERHEKRCVERNWASWSDDFIKSLI